jgi:hypothetical protein
MESGISLSILFHVDGERWETFKKLSLPNKSIYIPLTFYMAHLWKKLKEGMDFVFQVIKLTITTTFIILIFSYYVLMILLT